MRRYFAEWVGVIFAASILLVFLFAGPSGTVLLLAIGLGAAGVTGTVWQRRRELRRGRP
jgi:hypothetical protein